MNIKQPKLPQASPVMADATPTINWSEDLNGGLNVRLAGRWHFSRGAPSALALFSYLATCKRGNIVQLDTSALAGWDSTLLVFVRRLKICCDTNGLVLDVTALPETVNALLAQAEVYLAQPQGREVDYANDMLERTGRIVLSYVAELGEQVRFLKLVVRALAMSARKGNQQTAGDFLYLVHRCGPSAVPIVGLITLLVGMILAFVGAVQLRQFGAQLYIADLVGLGMSREMGAMMTAIIIAGRTGAAYAAELGSMRVNEEINALRTLGIDPIEFLVVPRIVALILVTPLLCIYADFMGIMGGAAVTVGLFDISIMEYFNESRVWLGITDFYVGIAKSAIFAGLVATAGCMRGMHCGSSSSDVGYAATSAVVTSIVWVVVADALLTLIITTLNI